MDTEQLHRLLGSLSGHLVAESRQQENEIGLLHQSLSRSLLGEDLQQLKGSSFAFENADLFSTENIPTTRLDSLRTIAEQKEAAEPEFRVFLREVTVRSTQLHASMPLWAAGAAVDHTLGPFTNKDGRKFWFDFFIIEKLVALYIQGRPDPVLLFKVNVDAQFVNINLPLVTEPLPSYKLLAGSIWINSQLLAANAPSGYYTGLTIKGGTITLNAPPQLSNGKLTISPGTVVTVRLQLKQPPLTDGDASSPYGIDARRSELQLPAKLSFQFSGSGSSLNEVASAEWKVYGHEASFRWNKQQVPAYDNLLNRVLVPFDASTRDFAVSDCQSPFYTLTGQARIGRSAWALPAAPIDILHPTPAAGIGALLVRCQKGLTNTWQGLRGGEFNLNQPYLMAEPGRIGISDAAAGNVTCQQNFKLWRDKQNAHGTSVQLQYPQATPFFYNTLANGNEALMVLGNADVEIDRPVTVTAEALAIRSRNSLLILAVSKTLRLIYLLDDNILFDSVDFTAKPPSIPKPIALALHNALFKVTPANGCLLFGSLAEDFVKVDRGVLYLTFGLYAYLPTLPDPYAANLGSLKFQFHGRNGNLEAARLGGQNIWLWLVCQVKWLPTNTQDDAVEMSFHFAPLQNQFQQLQATAAANSSETDARTLSSLSQSFFNVGTPTVAASTDNAGTAESARFNVMARSFYDDLPDYGAKWDAATGFLQQDSFALLDVSTNADLLGVSFGLFGDRRMAMITTHGVAPASSQSAFPLQVQGMDVVSQGRNVRAFTVPLISWEPVVNLTPRVLPGDPDAGFNYYPDDGGPTRIVNSSGEQVALAPIPLTDFLVDTFARDDQFVALALFTLPFGLKALGWLQNQYPGRKGTTVTFKPKLFENNIGSSRQLEIHAGDAPGEGQSKMFRGSTVQLNNILDLGGAPTSNSTLGRSVTRIFNGQFFPGNVINESGVPLERIDISGYGASIFSNWLNSKAPIASTSQAKFDVFVGRCAHEIIQVKSILYPWGINVVRTITLFRTGSGYEYRYDSGWKAESDGRFDFSYLVYLPSSSTPLPSAERQAPYEIHPGIVSGLFNVRDIRETEEIAPFTGTMSFANSVPFVDQAGIEQPSVGTTTLPFELQPVFFNADVEIENPISAYVSKTVKGVEKRYVPSKRILGFVQIAPLGQPLTTKALAALVTSQQGSIGGPLDCVVNIGNSGQQMRLNRFDVSNSFAANGTDSIFVVAGRGNVILPKDGSWSMVKHEQSTGEVTPVSETLSVPLIRIGKLVKIIDDLTLDRNPAAELLRVASPTELLRLPASDTINYGFLQSTDTQKALFLTPSYAANLPKLLSKTPPLFADAFRLVNSKAIFPNIGDAATNFGKAISLMKSGSEFIKNPLADGGKQVLELMQIDQVVGNVSEQGYRLLKKVTEFDLPSTELDLINISGAFRIFIEYKANNVQSKDGGTNDLNGKLDFDVSSFANTVADRWKSRMANVGIVVDLGPIKRLMTIKGTWDSQKGSEAEYKGDPTNPNFPSPQIEFSKELQPVIDILQILQDLQGDNYKDAFQKGLKLAMSNKAGSWEYKFEASKEIPVLRFPVPAIAYNDPNVPLKLEAGLKLGAYFNAALKVTTDPTQLLPTAGAYVGFYGRLSVMCVSLSIATVYAVGQVNLDIAADSKAGPSLRMKFGVGAQIVVGLPVVGNVSLLYMVGVEIFVDKTKLVVSAFLLYQGQAELLGGLVGVTITIEAKGTISRADDRTDLAAQVTFGLDISIFLVIDISFSTSWQEQRQIA